MPPKSKSFVYNKANHVDNVRARLPLLTNLGRVKTWKLETDSSKIGRGDGSGFSHVPAWDWGTDSMGNYSPRKVAFVPEYY